MRYVYHIANKFDDVIDFHGCRCTGMAVLYYDPKTGFSAAISPNVDRSG